MSLQDDIFDVEYALSKRRDKSAQASFANIVKVLNRLEQENIKLSDNLYAVKKTIKIMEAHHGNENN